jgi:RHS repeat-associated protein
MHAGTTPGVNSSFVAAASSTPSETLTVAGSIDGIEGGQCATITINGTPHAGDILSVIISDARLTNGSSTATYTVQSGDSLNSIAYNFGANISNQIGYGIFSYGFIDANVISVTDQPTNPTGTNSMSVVGSITGLASETATVNYANDQNYNLTIGGTITAGDIISLTVDNPSLAGGQTTVSYTTISTDTPTSVATALTHAVNVSTALNTLGVGATSSAAILSLHSDPYYTTSTNGGATETLSVGTNRRGNAPITVGGTATTGDVLTITTNYASLSGGTHAVSYTVLSTDTPLSIANGLTAALAADTTLQSVGVTAAANSAFLSTSETFSGNALLPSGSSLASVAATDGSGNVKTATHQLTVTGPAATSLSYDANGNLTNDGTNTYLWDAENRLLKINYPGSGNNSQFTYDSYGHTVAIVETVASTVTGTKLFVWTKDKMWQSRPCESRNSSGTVTAQYFNCGEEINGTNYFWTFDHIGSVREMTNSVGTIVDQRSYDAFGRVTQLQGSTASDFQFGGYYYHAPSGLSLATFRAYSSHLGRWINRDPISERGGINLYAYVENDPILKKDSLGLDSLGFALEGWNDVWAIGWVNSLIGLGLSYGASSNAKSSKLPGPNNGPQDAYRHCLWSCMMAGYMGPLAAKVAGDNHEGDNGEGAPRNAANAMDAANNAAGRAAAAGGGDCACKCRGLLGSGGLVGTNGMPMTPKGMTFLTPGFQGGKEQ